MENSTTSDGIGAAVAGVDLPPVSPQLFPGVEPDGEIFDPAIHAANPDGSPKLLTTGANKGKFARKRGRKGKDVESIEEEAQRRAAAVTFATLFLSLVRGIGGEEWQPDPGEKEELVQAFSDYFEAAGTIDLPPSLVLLSAIAGYAMRRLDQPETKKRIGKLMRKMRGIKQEPINGDGGANSYYQGAENASPNNRSS